MIKQLFSKNALSAVAVLCALFLGTAAGFAQNRSISGTVKDANGEPVIGAAVILVGNSSVGTITDADGKYVLSVPAGASVEVSSIGYASQTIAVRNQSVINVVLADDSTLLEETVVIGYGVQKKSDLTGSVASVASSELKNRSTVDAAAALQGKAAGVQILNTSGAPGQGAAIRVRGYSSNSGELGPLLIVDGLKVDNIQYLDPSLIESMEVLKDAASAAIYGAQAGNGVVLITTKAGEKGSAHITYNMKFTNQSLAKKVDMLHRDDFITFQREARSDVDAFLSEAKDNGTIDTDWQDAVFAPSWNQQHSLTFTGGNNKGHFFANLNYVKNDGIVKGNKDVYERFTAQMNADYQLFKWLNVGTNTSIEKWNTRSVGERGMYNSTLNATLLLDPLTPVYVDNMSDLPASAYTNGTVGDATGFIYPLLKDPKNDKYYGLSHYNLENNNGNPLLQRDRQDSSSGGFSVRGTLFANFTPVKGLVLTSRFGYRISQSTSHNYSSPFWATGKANSKTYSISANANTGFYYQWENFANYNIDFGRKKAHSISAMVGMSYTANKSDGVSASASGPDPLKGYEKNFQFLNYVNSNEDTVKSIGNAPNSSVNLSYFARLIYSWGGRYSIQGNFRADAFDSSKLSKKTRWGYFPSVSVGWTISNEPFVKNNVDPHVLNLLKIRASYGVNGNINVLSGYRYSASISQNSKWYQFDGPDLSYGSAPSGSVNEDLKWETSKQLDLGVDVRLFDNRFSIGLDYFNKNTDGLLLDVPSDPAKSPFSTIMNAGKINNKGVELELGWKQTVGDFSYSINGNVSWLKNEVKYLDERVGKLESQPVSGSNGYVRTIFKAGEPIWYFRGPKYAGVDKEGSPLYWGTDENGNYKPMSAITRADDEKLGSGIPKVTYGLTLNFAWKGIDLLVFGTGVAGNKIYNNIYTPEGNYINMMQYFFDNRWTGATPNAKFPRADAIYKDQTFWSSSAAFFSGAYFKFKQIQLGYTLPQRITKKAFISDLRVYVSLDDFFTITKYPGLDPETATMGGADSMGIDVGTYPTMKKVVLGLNLTF